MVSIKINEGISLSLWLFLFLGKDEEEEEVKSHKNTLQKWRGPF